MATFMAFVAATPAVPRALPVLRSATFGRPLSPRLAVTRRATFRPIRCQSEDPINASSSEGVSTEPSPAHTPAPPAGPPPQVSADALKELSTDEPSVEQQFAQQNEISNSVDEDQSVTTDAPSAASETQASSSQDATEEKRETSRDSTDKRRRRRTRKREVTLPLEELTEGMELEGVVKSVMQYGAFIGDIGTPTDGLLHVSQLTAGFVENVSDVVNIGDKVNVRVLSVDLERRTFSLTMRTSEDLASSRSKQEKKENPRAVSAARRGEKKKKWEAFTFDPDVFVNAKVLSVTDFGGFCQLLNENGEPLETAPTDGLVHISELSKARVENVSDVLTVGEVIKVRVVSTDPKRNRISMSLKPVSSDSEPAEKEASSESASISKDIAAAEADQPTFKTSFELAFAKAEASADK